MSARSQRAALMTPVLNIAFTPENVECCLHAEVLEVPVTFHAPWCRDACKREQERKRGNKVGGLVKSARACFCLQKYLRWQRVEDQNITSYEACNLDVTGFGQRQYSEKCLNDI